jgi:hypothetical protein
VQGTPVTVVHAPELLQVLAQVPDPTQATRTVPRTLPLTVMHFPSCVGSAHD